MAARLVLLALLGLCQSLAAESRGLAILNKRNLIELAKFSRDTLAIDVRKNRGNEEERSKATEAVVMEILKYVDKTSRDQTTRLQETLQDMVDVTMSNVEAAVLQNKISHNSLQNRSQENEENISRAIATNINTMLEEVEQRMKQHEQLLSTSVEACGENYQHYGQGVVSLSIWNWSKTRIGGVEKESPLSRTGYFTVPEGGEGTYKIAYSVIIDTVSDSQVLLNPSYFTLRLWYGRGHTQIMEGSRVTATAGTFDKDLVPASKEVLVDLKVGDSVSLFQELATAGISYNITFCAHLVKPLLAAGTQWESLSAPSTPVLKRTPTGTYNKMATGWHSFNSHAGISPIGVKMPKLSGIRSPRHRFMKFARPVPVRQEEDDSLEVNVTVGEVHGETEGSADENGEYGNGDQLFRDQTERFNRALQGDDNQVEGSGKRERQEEQESGSGLSQGSVIGSGG